MRIERPGLRALTTAQERTEIRVVVPPKTYKRLQGIKLKRTFDMTMCGQTLKFWRVIAPATHPNINSDLSLIGLKEWGIIP